MSQLTPLRRVAFAAVPSILCALVLFGAYTFVMSDERAEQLGKQLNLTAWERSYTERDLSVPASGPRTGYWGSRLGRIVKAKEVGWHQREIQIEGLLDIDARGFQAYTGSQKKGSEKLPLRVLILGGSVAFASYSSSIETTYFHLLGRGLEAADLPVRIDVFAAGAWKAVQEVRALRLHIAEYRPDLVVLLDGLNDLTVGATSQALYEIAESEEGSEQPKHARDHSRRVADYLGHVRDAAQISAAHGSALLVVLQPSLIERSPPSAHEVGLVRGTTNRFGSVIDLRASYRAMREGLHSLEEDGLLTFLDASKAFNAEPFTTFADSWHFADAGHRILADRMIVATSAILGGTEPQARQ